MTVETVEREPQSITLKQQIRTMESQFALAMPKGLEAAQLVRDALTCLQQTPKLGECVPQTVLGALMTCAQLGLRPGVNGLGHAWVLPYWDKNYNHGNGRKGAFVAQLIIGYKGYVDLAYRSGQIATVIGRTVYEGDTFDIEYGLDDKLIHKPATSGERSKPIGHYAIVKLANGGRSFWYMTEDEMQAWKRKYAPKSKAGNIVGPWNSDYEAMARKTCLLRLAAWMPKSTELSAAIEADNGVRTNIVPTITAEHVTDHPTYQQDEEPESRLGAALGDEAPPADAGVEADQ